MLVDGSELWLRPMSSLSDIGRVPASGSFVQDRAGCAAGHAPQQRLEASGEAAPGGAGACWLLRMLLAVLRLCCAPAWALRALRAQGCPRTGPAAWRAEGPGPCRGCCAGRQPLSAAGRPACCAPAACRGNHQFCEALTSATDTALGSALCCHQQTARSTVQTLRRPLRDRKRNTHE